MYQLDENNRIIITMMKYRWLLAMEGNFVPAIKYSREYGVTIRAISGLCPVMKSMSIITLNQYISI